MTRTSQVSPFTVRATDQTVQTLSKVKLPDDSRFEFTYTSWGQVWKVTSFAADNSVLNYRTYNLPETGAIAHDNCPRFTVRKDWAKYWNGDTDGTTAANEEVATATYIVPESANWVMPEDTQAVDGMRAQVTTADGTVNKIFYIGVAGQSSGWRRGLPALIDTFIGGPDPERRVWTIWTQDNTSLAYPLNPRVTETNVSDLEDNHARRQTTYEQFDLGNNMSCHLPSDVYEFANASTILRSTRTLYNMSATYKNLRILGLVSETQLYEGDVNNGGALMSKVAYFYDNDNGSSSIVGADAPVHHENPTFVTGRANLSSIRRYDVNNTTQYITARTKYNTAGSIVSAKDASDHEVTISYADSFSDGISRNTLAYPTTETNPDTFVSTAKYNFDFGGVTSERTPKPNEITNVPEIQRPQRVFTYDTIGRLQQITSLVNNSYTRFVYSTTNSRVDTFSTVQQSMAEAHSWEITDGFGRVIATAKDHTATTFSGLKMVYDVMGRVFKTSNPTETTASGHPSAVECRRR